MVVTFLPATLDTGLMQHFSGAPSISTMQQPHCSSPQPNRVPIRPSSLRKTLRSGVSSLSNATLTGLPLTVNLNCCAMRLESKLLAQDPFVEVVAGVEQHVERDAVVHAHVHAAHRAHLVMVG